MEMINVLKRLAELDSGNPNVEARMTIDTPLATLSNVYENTQEVEECGDMPGPSNAAHSPANISVTANSGDEVASMLKSLMALAGLSDSEPVSAHKNVEISTPHVAKTDNDDMARMISMIDGSDDHHEMADDSQDEGWAYSDHNDPKYDDDSTDATVSPRDKERARARRDAEAAGWGTDDERENEGRTEETYDNSPEPEIEPHDYGDKQVKPKQQGFAQRIGDNPYKMAHESINNLSSQLLKEYEAFKNAQ